MMVLTNNPLPSSPRLPPFLPSQWGAAASVKKNLCSVGGDYEGTGFSFTDGWSDDEGKKLHESLLLIFVLFFPWGGTRMVCSGEEDDPLTPICQGPSSLTHNP